jgi:hypothetical protein
LVKYLFWVTLLATLSFGASLNKEIENILGKGSYAAKKGLIAVLFKNRSDFLRGNRVDILKVLQTLEENHLLELQFNETKTLHLSFATTDKKPLLFIKTIKDVLNAVGYNHTLTSKAVRDESGFLWKVSLSSAAMVDPLLLAKELQKRGAYITSIKRYSKDNWRYNVDIYHAKVKAKKIPFNKKTVLRKPLNAYWIEVMGGRSISIDSRGGNNWHPYIIFYDKNLKILDNYTKERKSYNVSLKIPRDAKYIKIGDLYTLENLKRGVKVTISKRK